MFNFLKKLEVQKVKSEGDKQFNFDTGIAINRAKVDNLIKDKDALNSFLNLIKMIQQSNHTGRVYLNGVLFDCKNGMITNIENDII